MYAMTAAERGVRAPSSGTLKGAVKKELPNPAFPAEVVKDAA